MCIEIMNNNANLKMDKNNNIKNTKKISYTIKKALQKIFKKDQLLTKEAQQIVNENFLNTEKTESLESLENLRNADIEQENISLESYENEANERISISHQTISHEIEDYDLSELPTVPVHFVRTEHGTFFWTATTDFAADNDLIEPLYCSTNNQIATHQMQDRWAQA